MIDSRIGGTGKVKMQQRYFVVPETKETQNDGDPSKRDRTLLNRSSKNLRQFERKVNNYCGGSNP